MTPLLALDADAVSAGPFALLIIGVLLVVTVLLIKNMGRRLRNLPAEFPDDPRGLRARDDEDPPTG
jgi:hypothetical protein